MKSLLKPLVLPAATGHLLSHRLLSHRLLLLLAALSLLLTGCANRPTVVWTNPALPERWEAEGKAAVRSANRGGNLYFTWTQTGADYRIIVRGPLGLGRAELNGRPGEVRLQADNLKQEVSAGSLEELLEATTRHRAPVSHALHWIKAEPATAKAVLERSTDGKLSRIKEDGWTIDYLEWSEEAPNLPRKLTLEGPEGKATVIVGLWRLTPEALGEPPVAESAP